MSSTLKRSEHRGSGIGSEYFHVGGIVDTALNLGKTALNLAKDIKELISAVGSIAGAASQISRAQESA